MNLDYLWPYPRKIETSPDFPVPSAVSLLAPDESPKLRDDLASIAGLRLVPGNAPYAIRSSLDPAVGPPESYRLSIAPAGIDLVGADRAGLFYAAQTLLQILSLCRRAKNWPGLLITDSPAYPKRALMIDMGRATFSLSLLKRIVRILARLKMNQLHLHLYDDQLCGIRFDGFPFGSANPCAISIVDLADLVRYAADYHVEIMPELEGWAHVGALVYHRPDLRGGPGMYNSGSSFLVGPKMFDLMRELTRQVVDVLPATGVVHFGLDEAQWFPDPALPATYSTTDMVRAYHDLLQDVAARAHKTMTMQVWADHGGRPIPDDLQPHCIIEPWQYWRKNAPDTLQAVEKYSANPRLRWVMGAGQSVAHSRGAYYATALWCRSALKSANCLGPDVTLWGWNDLDHKLISLFAGAYFAWNPEAPTSWTALNDDEVFDQQVYPIMRAFQSRFPDANPDRIAEDRGPVVLMGFYLWGPRHGKPVDPTAAVPGISGWAWTPDQYSDEPHHT